MDLLNGIIPPELRSVVFDVLGTGGGTQPRRRSQIAHTLIQSPNRLVIQLEMPGFTKDTVDVDFYNNQVNITGHKSSPVLLDDEKVMKTTIKCGQFQESITLSVSVTNRENVTIKYLDGVLQVIIDLVREERNRFKINLAGSAAGGSAAADALEHLD